MVTFLVLLLIVPAQGSWWQPYEHHPTDFLDAMKDLLSLYAELFRSQPAKAPQPRRNYLQEQADRMCHKQNCNELAVPEFNDFWQMKFEAMVLFPKLNSTRKPTKAKRDTLWLEPFQEEWLTHMNDENHFLYNHIDRCYMTEEAKVWFRLLETPEDEQFPWKWQCPVCMHYSDVSSFKQPAGSKEPVMYNSKKENNKAMRRHTASKTHMNAMALLQRDMNDNVVHHLKNKNDISNSMINMLRLVYTSVKSNIASRNHPKMVELLQNTGANIGVSLNGIDAFDEILDFMSVNFHNELIKKLQRNRPVSIILDGSDDRQKNHLISVSFLTLSNNKPSTYFYRLLDTSDDRGANALKDSFIEALIEDNIYDQVKQNLIGIGVDGASVMTREQNSFDNLLKSHLEKPNIITTWCVSHKLELISTHGLKDNVKIGPAVGIINSFVNNIYSYYHSSSKRVKHLKETASRLGMSAPNFKYVFLVRWLSTQVEAMIRIVDNWTLLIHDLGLSDGLGHMGQRLKDRRFRLFFIVITDFLEELRQYCLSFQPSEQSLVDVISFKTDLDAYLHQVLNGQALPRVKSFISSCTCGFKPCSGETEYLSSVTVLCDEVQFMLMPQLFSDISYTEFVTYAVAGLKEQLERYFPINISTDIQIFIPKKLPAKHEEVNNYGSNEVYRLAVHFGHSSPHDVVTEWHQMLTELMKRDDYCTLQVATPHFMWTTFLNSELSVKYENIATLIRLILVIPSGTVAAERSFSIMNHIKSPRSSTMGLKNLENRMRLTINGPENYELVPYESYAGMWQATRRTPDKPYLNHKEMEYSFRPLFNEND